MCLRVCVFRHSNFCISSPDVFITEPRGMTIIEENFREITECPFLQHPSERVYFQHHQEANRTGVFPPKIMSLFLKLKNSAPSNITLTVCTPSSLKAVKFAGYLC